MRIPKEFVNEWVYVTPYDMNTDELSDVVPYQVAIKIIKIQDNFIHYETYVGESFVSRYGHDMDSDIDSDIYNENVIINKVKGILDIDCISELHTLLTSEKEILSTRENYFNNRKRLEKVAVLSEHPGEHV
jgi:hypothetical protein